MFSEKFMCTQVIFFFIINMSIRGVFQKYAEKSHNFTSAA